MFAFKIYYGETLIGLEWGTSEQDALEHYAEGSIYPIDKLWAWRPHYA